MGQRPFPEGTYISETSCKADTVSWDRKQASDIWANITAEPWKTRLLTGV